MNTYEPEFKCDDCCHPDGTPREGIGCACGRNDDDYNDDYDGGEE